MPATAGPLPPLAPAGKWVVEGRAGELDCVLSRDFGDPAHPVGLAIRPDVTGRLSVVVSFKTDRLERFSNPNGTVTLLPATLALTGERGFKYSPDIGREAVEIALRAPSAKALLDGFAAASTIRVDIGHRGFLFAVANGRVAIQALSACRAEIIYVLGADPAAMIDLPTDKLSQWLKESDVPAADRKDLLASRVTVLVTAGPSGKPTACRSVVLIEHVAMADTICQALRRRADFGAGASAHRYALIRVSWVKVGSTLVPLANDGF